MKTKISFFSLVAVIVVGFSSAGYPQEVYPNKPIEVMVASSAGGGVDLHFRVLFEEVKNIWKVPITIINQSSGGGIVAANAVANAKKDGYTLLGILLSHVTTITVTDPKGPVNLLRDFDPVMVNPGYTTDVLVTRGDSQFRSLKDVVDYARKKPGELVIGTGAVGTNVNLEALMFKRSAKIDVTILPFSSSAETIQMLLGGHIHLGSTGDAAARSHITSGKMRVLAGVSRSAIVPDIPTYAEQGFSQVDMLVTTTLLGPKGLPPAVIKAWENALEIVVKDPKFLASFKKLGLVNNIQTGADRIKDLFKKEIEMYSRFTPEELGR